MATRATVLWFASRSSVATRAAVLGFASVSTKSTRSTRSTVLWSSMWSEVILLVFLLAIFLIIPAIMLFGENWDDCCGGNVLDNYYRWFIFNLHSRYDWEGLSVVVIRIWRNLVCIGANGNGNVLYIIMSFVAYTYIQKVNKFAM
ncbi:hypothetical protein J3Q64DRAFT_1775747 [Phycomyces blakesleeanus]|uniref:Uncharacterized protein n=1 Tax=Phycomyces blakesleeanus TaxID=4837 RepID=A0ABR3AIJ5_PHYBL